MRRKNLVIAVMLLITLLVSLTGCNTKSAATKEGRSKITVVTTLFPQYDFVKEIAGDKVEVSLLLPPGVEPHSFEPTPKDVADIKKADLFIYTGKYMEPWVEKVIEATQGGSLLIVNTSTGIDLIDEEEHNGHDTQKHEEEHHHGGKDPHIWVDPILAQKMVDNIVEGLGRIDLANASFYKKNGDTYKEKLQELDRKFADTFKKTKYKKIIYGGHFAFSYLAKRYGLEHISPYSGFAPNAEPTPQRIVELIKNMKESGLKTIYYEELIDPKVAKVIAAQTGAEMLLLHGAHNVSKDELLAGVTYLNIMEENLERLKQGLGYNE